MASQQLGAEQQLLHLANKRSSKHGLQHFTLQQLEGAQQEEGAAQVASQQPLPAPLQQPAGAAQVASQHEGLQHLLRPQ